MSNRINNKKPPLNMEASRTESGSERTIGDGSFESDFLGEGELELPKT